MVDEGKHLWQHSCAVYGTGGNGATNAMLRSVCHRFHLLQQFSGIHEMNKVVLPVAVITVAAVVRAARSTRSLEHVRETGLPRAKSGQGW